MRKFLSIALLVFTSSFSSDTSGQSADGKKLLHAELAKDRESESTNKFLSDTPKIVAFWTGDALKLGDKIRAIWIAEDVGYAELHNSKVTESFAVAYKPDDWGSFGLARPKTGWVLGKYRLELYVGTTLAETLSFTIEQGAEIQAP